MKNKNAHIDILISKKITGESNPEEQIELDGYLKDNPNEHKYIEETRKAWESSRTPLNSVLLNSDREKVKSQIILQLSANQQKTRRLQRYYWAAAVLVIPLLVFVGWYFGKSFKSIGSEQFCEVKAPIGQVAECTLTDGTKVWLNTGSVIKYNPDFTGKQRKVELIGEAYFEVIKNQHKPFIVLTKDINVKVLGTSFNVRAYPDESKTETILDEGKVQLSLADFPMQSPIDLKPGEYAVFEKDNKKVNISKTDTYIKTSWRDGKIIFKDADLKTISGHIEKLYDVSIHLKNEKIESMHFRGVIEYNQNILDALETIEKITGLNYRIKGREIWIE